MHAAVNPALYFKPSHYEIFYNGRCMIQMQKAVTFRDSLSKLHQSFYYLFNAFLTSFTVLGTSGMASAARLGA